MADRQKLRALHAKATSTLDRWSAAHKRASGLFASAVSVVERLPVMADDARFGPLADAFPDLPARTRVAQAEALHRVLESLQEEMRLFHALVGILERTHKDASALLSASKPAAAGAVRLGPTPSPAESVAGLQDLWRLHRDEASLKTALVREIHCDADAAQLAEASALFAAQPNLDPEETRVVVDRAEALGVADVDFSPRKKYL